MLCRTVRLRAASSPEWQASCSVPASAFGWSHWPLLPHVEGCESCVAFLLFKLSRAPGKSKTKTLFVLRVGKDKERRAWLSWYHLLASLPRDNDLVEYKHTPARSRGQPAEVYFRARRFLLAAPGFSSRSIDMQAFHQPLALWLQSITATRPISAFTLCSCRSADSFLEEGQIKTPFILLKDEERNVHSRGTTFICRCLAASTSSSTYILQSDDGDFRRFSSRGSRFFFAACVPVGFPPSPTLLRSQATVTRPFVAFAIFDCSHVS